MRRAFEVLRALAFFMFVALVAPSVAAEGTAPTSAVVRVHEREVYVVRTPRGGQSPEERARLAAKTLQTVLDEGDESDARVERQGTTAVIFVGNAPIITLTDEDAAAAGDATLDVHAATVATHITDGLRLERKRSKIATKVFSFSLLVFSAVIAFVLLRRVGDTGGKLRRWVRAHPGRIPALHLGNIEVVSGRAIRGVLSVALVIGHRLTQIAIAYAWVLVALSLFESTRRYTERLTGFVLTPLSHLLGRMGAALPLLVVAGVAILAIGVVVRFTALFFQSVARGETTLGWLPADLAEPTSVLARAGIVVVSLLLAAPLITGNDEGALSKAGVAAVVALGLASAPVLACAIAGVPQVYGRRLRMGDRIEIGRYAGRIKRVTLLEVELEDRFGCEIRLPQLLLLTRAVRLGSQEHVVSVDICVDARASQAAAYATLLTAARSVSERASVELVRIEQRGARYRVTGEDASGSLGGAIADALTKEGIGLGVGD